MLNTQTMLDQIEAIKAAGRAVTAGLTDEQLNWHFAEGSWSILDCLEHLNVSVTKTLPAFDRSIAAGRERGQTSNGRSAMAGSRGCSPDL